MFFENFEGDTQLRVYSENLDREMYKYATIA